MLLLGKLCPIQRNIGALKVGAGILQVLVEKQLKQLTIEVVMMGNVLLRTTNPVWLEAFKLCQVDPILSRSSLQAWLVRQNREEVEDCAFMDL